MSSVYSKLSQEWKSMTKILFKRELKGELKDYEDWIREYVKPSGLRKSSISGKEVRVFPDDFAKTAKYISFDEINFFQKFEPLDINEVKDIDTIINSIKERFYYTGNVVIGKSNYIESSTGVIDSFYVYDSWTVGYSRYVAYSAMIKSSEHIFGTLGDAESSYTLKNLDGHKNQRVFECYSSNVSSDLYYTSRLDNSTEAMFSFGLKGVHYVIGNIILEKSKYYSIKNALLEQIADELEKNHSVFSLLELVEEMPEPEIEKFEEVDEPEGDKAPIVRAFNTTTKILLNKELGDPEQYEDFLFRHVNKFYRFKSALSDSITYTTGYIVDYLNKPFDIAKRSVKLHEIREVGKHAAPESFLSEIRFDKELLKSYLKNIAFFSIEAFVGNINNVFDAVVIGYSRDCYHGVAYFYSKLCSHCFWPRESEHIFGSDSVWNSSFSINIYKSSHLNRSFEVTNSQNSSDLYFSHNVENIMDGMFNFNIKNLVNAIGNASYELEKYKSIKSSLIEQISNELETKKNLSYDIYTIASVES